MKKIKKFLRSNKSEMLTSELSFEIPKETKFSEIAELQKDENVKHIKIDVEKSTITIIFK